MVLENDKSEVKNSPLFESLPGFVVLSPAIDERFAELVALKEAAHGLGVGAHLQVLIQCNAVEGLEAKKNK